MNKPKKQTWWIIYDPRADTNAKEFATKKAARHFIRTKVLCKGCREDYLKHTHEPKYSSSCSYEYSIYSNNEYKRLLREMVAYEKGLTNP